MIHDARCDMVLTPNVGVKPTKVLDAAAHVEWRAEVPVTPKALGGQQIRLVVKGEKAAVLFKLLAALKEPGADTASLLEELRGLDEGCGGTPDLGPDGGSST